MEIENGAKEQNPALVVVHFQDNEKESCYGTVDPAEGEKRGLHPV